MGPDESSMGLVRLFVDGVAHDVPPVCTVLEACDLAGAYVPRLCTYPRSHCAGCLDEGGGRATEYRSEPDRGDDLPSATGFEECGLCLVRTGAGEAVLACTTPVAPGMEVITDDHELRGLRRARLAQILEGHPFACLLCPDRDGCSRDECSYGNPPEARCCDRYGDCELALLVAHVDPDGTLRPGAGPFDREAVTEGPIRREQGLCVGCGRCVVVCVEMEQAGDALWMVGRTSGADRRVVAAPKGPTLRASGCTFCGACVLVCPTGALMAGGESRERWLQRRRQTLGLAAPVLPPARRLTIEEARRSLGSGPGVLQLIDEDGGVLMISGVPQMAEGLERALRDLGDTVRYVTADEEAMYTQRESELLTLHARLHGCLPPGNDLGDDLFD